MKTENRAPGDHQGSVALAAQRLVFSAGRDVTENDETRRQLLASEQKYRRLVESIPDVVWSATLDGRATFISPNVATICGFTMAEVLAATDTRSGSTACIPKIAIACGTPSRRSSACSGPEIVSRVRRQSGDVAALFMSGYTDHAILQNRILQPGMNFIQKPFAPDTLAAKIREVLDAR